MKYRRLLPDHTATGPLSGLLGCRLNRTGSSVPHVREWWPGGELGQGWGKRI